ncbi:MAG: class I SAM-dependent methyltransferase [Pseudomonadales bacterium]|nr:class I SAM-dependent methyltransferase [Pseudomonadales bacterium]
MSRNTINLSDPLRDYIRTVGMHEDADLVRLREETARHPAANMQISPEQGHLMSLLVRMLGARKTLEIGVFTGYSAMVVAKALGPNGKVLALDVNEAYTNIARRHWASAGIAERIDLRLAPAADTLRALIATGEAASFDFAFIDADKENYATYYEHALRLVRRGGVIAIDNVLWAGKVIDASDQTKDTVAIRALNEQVHGDKRVDATVLPVGDGLTLALKL